MKLSLWRSPILAVAVVAGLAAGTALVAGYVDKPNEATTATAAEDKCSDCPRLNTDECCQVTGTCANPQTCEGDCTAAEAGAGSCAGKQAGPNACCEGTPEGAPACCGQEEAPACSGQEEAPAGACPVSGCEAPAESCCGAGGCCALAK